MTVASKLRPQRRFFPTILCLGAFASVGVAQHAANGAEYFFDLDPGNGLGTPIDIIAGAAVNVVTSASIAELGPGRHILFVRLKEEDGGWGAPVGSEVVVSEPPSGQRQIAQAEYFFDHDPGTGSGTSLPLTAGPFVTVIQQVSAAGLSKGPHRVFLRLKSGLGEWGQPIGQSIVVSDSLNASELVQGEYFFDADPGNGSGAPLPLLGTPTSTNSSLQVSVAGLSATKHTLFTRFRDDRGTWGASVGSSFLVSAPAFIAGAEFYIDAPGTVAGTGIQMTAVNAPFDSAFEYAQASLDTSMMPAGTHHIFVRVRDSEGRWSNLVRDSVLFGGGVVVVQPGESGIPLEFALSQNYPNPFNPSTTIRYQVPEAVRVMVRVYNVMGQMIETLVDTERAPGFYDVRWSPRSASSGVYFYRISAGAFTQIRKMVMMR